MIIIHVLSPVKYAVSPNEDVFEYIKFDIIHGIVMKYYEFKSNPDYG
jgi:hypothetical protein